MTTRRWLAGVIVGGLLAGTLAGCQAGDTGEPAELWHSGELTIGTGPSNGVFNQVGGGYADVINRHLSGYEALAPPTNGAGENLQRLARGDVEIAFTFADVAADAVKGEGLFKDHPVSVKALARVFNSYAHLVVRAPAKIRSIADLRGKRVATGPVHSGTEEVSLRLLAAAGLNPDKDLARVSASLSQMTASMKAGTLDAMFYSAGLPTVGLTALFSQFPGQFVLVPLDSAFAALDEAHPGIYTREIIAKTVYGLAADVPTIAVPNLIVVDSAMPDDLAYELTKLLFEYQSELAAVHPEGKNILRAVAPKTHPVPLAIGAQRYYNSG